MSGKLSSSNKLIIEIIFGMRGVIEGEVELWHLSPAHRIYFLYTDRCVGQQKFPELESSFEISDVDGVENSKDPCLSYRNLHCDPLKYL